MGVAAQLPYTKHNPCIREISTNGEFAQSLICFLRGSTGYRELFETFTMVQQPDSNMPPYLHLEIWLTSTANYAMCLTLLFWIQLSMYHHIAY